MDKQQVATIIYLFAAVYVLGFLFASVRSSWYVQSFELQGLAPMQDSYYLLWRSSCSAEVCWDAEYYSGLRLHR